MGLRVMKMCVGAARGTAHLATAPRGQTSAPARWPADTVTLQTNCQYDTYL
jgi:hypothetical protein